MLQKLVITALFILMSLCGPVSALSQNVAVVGKNPITLKSFKEKYEEVRRQTINPPEPEVFLEDLIRFEVGLQEAEKRKVEKDPVVQEEIRKVVYKHLVEKAIGNAVNKIKISEKEMQQFYKNNPELRTSHILIEIKPGANDKEKAAAKKRAQEIYNEVRKSKRPFEELVKLYTDDSLSKSTGGDIGYQSKVTLVPTYYDAASSMKVGQIKGLVETRYGFHIIKLTGRRAYQQANKRQIRAAVFDEKRKQIFDKYFEGLKRKYTINKNNSLLKEIK